MLTIAFAFGLSVVAMTYAIGGISGCQINPAITLAVWLFGRMSGREAAGYMVAKAIGAIVDSSILFAITSNMVVSGTGANSFGEGMLVSALISELIFTVILTNKPLFSYLWYLVQHLL